MTAVIKIIIWVESRTNPPGKSMAYLGRIVGKNCGLIEYGCSSDLDIYDYFRLLFKHPSFLFGSEQLYTFGSTINICENGCTQGACVKLRIGEKCGSDFGPACESNLCVSGYCVEKQD